MAGNQARLALLSERASEQTLLEVRLTDTCAGDVVQAHHEALCVLNNIPRVGSARHAQSCVDGGAIPVVVGYMAHTDPKVRPVPAYVTGVEMQRIDTCPRCTVASGAIDSSERHGRLCVQVYGVP